MELEDTLCYCFHVSRRKVFNFLRREQPRRVSQVSACGGAGTGCGWCVPFIRKMFDQMQQSGQIETETLTAADYARQRASYIREGKGTPTPNAIPLPELNEGRWLDERR